jgi:hypothetical protein
MSLSASRLNPLVYQHNIASQKFTGVDHCFASLLRGLLNFKKIVMQVE